MERKTLAFVGWRYTCCGLRLTNVAADSALVLGEMASEKGPTDNGERV